MWLAALAPALLILHSIVSFSRVSNKIKLDDHPAQSLSCVETYAVTRNLSDQYVREGTFGTWLNNTGNRSPELATVVRGMARNNCGENLKSVRLKFVVRDDAGAKGDGFYLIDAISEGEVKTFERAWMGHVTSYEITASR